MGNAVLRTPYLADEACIAHVYIQSIVYRKPFWTSFGLYYSGVALPISAEAPVLEGFMTRRLLDTAIRCMLLLLLLAACQAEAVSPLPTLDEPSATETARVYLDNLASLAATAAFKNGPGIALLVSTPTNTSPAPTISPIPENRQPPPSADPTGLPETTPFAQTNGIQPNRFAACNRIEFVSDLTTPDDSIIPPGNPFEKTWGLKNSGTCTWTPDYQLVFVDGVQMQGQAVNLPLPVAPGETITLKVPMVAPLEAGSYQGLWMLQGPQGRFGLGREAREPLWVKIQVPVQIAAASPTPMPASTNLAQGYCSAEWVTNLGRLECPGNSDSPNGFAITLDRPQLESRNENEIALYTHPPLVENGWIAGTYPPYTVQAGDHFLADIGCLAHFTNCQVEFMLAYLPAGADPVILGRWQEYYDQKMTRVDVDLSGLAGQTIQLILSVRSQGDSGQAGAFWLVPQIRR